MDVAVTRGATSVPTVPGRTKVYTHTGALSQNYTAALPLHRFDVSHGVKTPAQYQAILDLWYVVHFTPYSGFRYKDWRDYVLTQANSRLTFIAGSTWQINRLHSYGGIDFLRPVYKPAGAIVVKRTRSGVVSTAGASIDATTGIATINDHVAGDTYTCEGEFDVPVTFSDDEWNAELQGHVRNLWVVAGAIKLEEIRP